MPDMQTITTPGELLERAVNGGRLSLEEGVSLYQNATTEELKQAADAIRQRKHRLQVELPPQPVPLEADSLRLAQLLSNLLVNSAKYTPEGGRIRLAGRVDGYELRVDVEDNGMGMDDAELARRRAD